MSTYLIPVFYAVLQLIILIAVGFFARRLGNWTDEFFVGLSRFADNPRLPVQHLFEAVDRLSAISLSPGS